MIKLFNFFISTSFEIFLGIHWIYENRRPTFSQQPFLSPQANLLFPSTSKGSWISRTYRKLYSLSSRCQCFHCRKLYIVDFNSNFLKLFLVYETIRISYLHYMHHDECNQASSLWLASVSLNLLWIFVALIGISAINSRKTQRVSKYKILLFLVGVSRMLFYLGMYIMKKSTSSSNNNDLFCSSIYKDEIYLLSTILEGAVISILIFLIHTVKGYIKGK